MPISEHHSTSHAAIMRRLPHKYLKKYCSKLPKHPWSRMCTVTPRSSCFVWIGTVRSIPYDCFSNWLLSNINFGRQLTHQANAANTIHSSVCYFDIICIVTDGVRSCWRSRPYRMSCTISQYMICGRRRVFWFDLAIEIVLRITTTTTTTTCQAMMSWTASEKRVLRVYIWIFRGN